MTPEQFDTALFTLALTQATDRLRLRYAETPGMVPRIEKAYKIVRAGGVRLPANPMEAPGIYLVQSQSQSDTEYAVNGLCPCADATYTAPAGRCKHKLARALYRKAHTLADAWHDTVAHLHQCEDPSHEGPSAWVCVQEACGEELHMERCMACREREEYRVRDRDDATALQATITAAEHAADALSAHEHICTHCGGAFACSMPKLDGVCRRQYCAYCVDLMAQVPTPTQPLPEAPASANVYLMIQGHRVQLTLRGHQEDEVLERLAVILARYPVQGGEGK